MTEWGLSEHTRSLVYDLNEGYGFRDILKPEKWLSVVNQIAQSGEPAAVAGLLIWRKLAPTLMSAIVETVDHLVCQVASEDLRSYSKWLRHQWGDYAFMYTGAYRLVPKDLHRFDKVADEPVPCFWGALSMHPNGYVRESALSRLAKSTIGQEVPFLLLRTVDWVPQVRNKAIATIKERITPKYARCFAENLLLLTPLQKSDYRESVALVGSIEDLLLQEPTSQVLLEQIDSAPRRTRRMAFSFAIRGDEKIRRQAIDRARHTVDPVLRTRAIETAPHVVAADELQNVLAEARHDPHRLVRNRALHAYVDMLPDKADPPLRQALFDTSATNRQLARFYLKRRGENDFHSLYRQALGAKDVQTHRAGLRGLTDIGQKSDVEDIRAFLKSGSSKTRRIALQALVRLDPSGHIEHFYTALSDPIASYSSVAALALRKVGPNLEAERLLKTFKGNDQPHTGINILRAARGLPTWKRLYFYLCSLGYADRAEKEYIHQALANWCAHSSRLFTAPDSALAESIGDAFLEGSRFLAEPLRVRLRDVLSQKKLQIDP